MKTTKSYVKVWNPMVTASREQSAKTLCSQGDQTGHTGGQTASQTKGFEPLHSFGGQIGTLFGQIGTEVY